MSLELGFIGAGGIARAHLANLRAIDGVVVRAVSDVNAGQAEQFAVQAEARAYTCCNDMLEAEAFDAVYICLPPGAHGGLEIEIAELGIPFYVEKPVHLDLVAAAEVSSIVAEKGLITSVGYQLRYSDAVKAAGEFLADREVALAQGFYVGGLPGAPWWRRRDLSGGQAVEQSTHIYDLLRYLLGDAETVCARASTGAMADVEGYDVDDASVALLEFSSGAVGHVVSACVLTDGGEREASIRLDGRSFTLRLQPDSLHVSDGGESRSQEFSLPRGGWMGRADRAFVQAVRTGDASGIRSSYASGVRTLALTLAVNRSIETGEPVSPAELLLAASH
jgi:myo-inositol 2-dehydrogenase/D-chiro-inositol 1-dehydrogenase